jgi:hypothetical protein
MYENSLVPTVGRRAQVPTRSPQRPVRGVTADGAAPHPVALLVAPALLAVCFR